VNLFSRIVSIVVHPLLASTYIILLLAFTLPTALEPIPMQSHMSFVLLIFIITFLLPGLNLLILKIVIPSSTTVERATPFSKTIANVFRALSMQRRSERVVPFVFIALLFCTLTYLFYAKYNIHVSDNLFKLLIVMNALVVLAAGITFFYKISIHSMGIWGMIGVILPLNTVSENGALFLPTLVLLVVAGVVMASRLQLQTHSMREVTAGAVVGFATSFSLMIFLF